MRQVSQEVLIFTAAGATGTGLAQLVSDFQHLMLTLSSSGSATFTIKFQGSMATDKPDFSASATDTNRWDYVQVKDLITNAAIDGATGVSYTGTDNVKQYEVNTNGLNWICATIVPWTQGAVSLRLKCFSEA